MANKNAVELILKATDLSSKTFSDVSAAVTALNAKLAEQTAAAAKGQVSVKELAATMRQLQEAGAALSKQGAEVAYFKTFAANLATAQEKAGTAREALEALKATVAAQDAPTKAQTAEVAKLEKAYDRAEAAVAKIQTRLEAQTAKLAEVGVNTAALATAEEELAASATVVNESRRSAQATIDAYDTTLREHRATVAATAAAEKEAAAQTALAAKQAAEAQAAATAVVEKAAREEAAFLATYAEAERENNSFNLAARNADTARLAKERVAIEQAATRAEAKFDADYAEAERENNSVNLTAKLTQERAAIKAFNDAVESGRREQKRINDKFDADFLEATREANSRRLTEELKATKDAEAGWARMAALRTASEVGGGSGASGSRNGQQPGFLGLKPFELKDLSFQVNDVITQLSLGQGLFRTFASQGGQVFQIFEVQIKDAVVRITEALESVGLSLGIAIGAFAVATLAVGAFVAAAIRLDNTKEAVRQLTAEFALMADGTRYVATAVVGIQRELQRLGAGFDDAGIALRTFIAAGVQQDKLLEFGKAAQEIAHTFGVTLPEAAKTLVQAFDGGYASVVKLDREYNIYTAKQLETIRNLFDEGKATEARAMAQDIFTGKLATTAKLVDGDFKKAWQNIYRATYDFLDLLGNSALARIAGAAISALATGLNNAALGLRLVLDSLPGGGGATNDPAVIQRLIDEKQRQLTALDARVKAAGGSPDRPATSTVSGLQTATGQAVSQEQYLNRRRALLFDINELQEKLTASTKKDTQATKDNTGAVADGLTPAQRQLKIDQDLVDTQAKQLAQARGPTPAERVKAVGEKAQEAALESHASPETAALIGEKARVEERRKILEENRGLTEAIQQQASAAAANADKSQKADLDRRLRAIDEQYEQFHRKVEDLRRRDVQAVDGKSLDDYELELAKNKNDLKLAETVKFNKEQVALQNGVRNELAALIAAAGKSQKDDLDAQLNAVTETYSRIGRSVAAAQAAGVKTVGGRSIEEVKGVVAAQEELIKQQVTIKFYETGLAEAVKARDTTLKTIVDNVKDGTTSAAEGYAQALKANEKLTPAIAGLAEDALKFAKALGGAEPSPQLAAFIASSEKALKSTETTKTSATGTADTGIATASLARANDLITTRNTLEKAYQNLVAEGTITQHEANALIESVYKGAAADITAATDAFAKFIEVSSDTLPVEQVALLRAELAKLRTEVAYTDPTFKKLKTSIEQSVANSAVKAIDTLTTSIGNVIAGTETIAQGFRDAGIAAAQFVADVLKGVAQEIIKEQILIQVKAASKALGFHGGGVVGSPSSGMTRAVDPSWFVAAPRYHDGAVVGLGADEQAAILKKGEEVLTRQDPRNVLNSGTKAGAASGPTNIRSVLVLDNGLIPQAMQSSDGEAVTMSHIKKNVSTIRQMVR